MNWFLIAIGAPFLWALVNIADQYLIAKYSDKEKENSSGGLVLFSSLIGLVIAFFIAISTKGIFNVPALDILILMTSGLFTLIWIVLYLYALEIDDISNIVPWFLTVPVFGYIAGYLFLGETLTDMQIFGSVIVLFGTSIMSIDFASEKRRFKKKPVLYMLVACVLVALSGVMFKYVTIEDNFWVSSFWEYAGLGLTGLCLYMFVPKYRKEFMDMNRAGGRKIFALNTASELATVSGNLLTNFALLLAPVTMVYLVGSFQPAIVLMLTILSTKFFPHIVTENISKKVLIPKIIAIVIMIAGSMFLFV
jgi:drug/metabolite transporter (DMT)-like permease